MATLSPWTTIFAARHFAERGGILGAVWHWLWSRLCGVTLLNPAPLPLKLAAVSLPVTVKSPPIVATPLYGESTLDRQWSAEPRVTDDI